MADSTRFELATSAVTVQRSNQLSYESIYKCESSILKNIWYANFFYFFFIKRNILAIYSFYFKYFFEERYHVNHQINTKTNISTIYIYDSKLKIYKSEKALFTLFKIIIKIM